MPAVQSVRRPFAALLLAATVAGTIFASSALSAQTSGRPSAAPVVASRLTAAIRNDDRMTLPGTASPHAIAAYDLGAVSPSTRVAGMTLVFARSAAQQADLDALTTAQQNPASPLFHQWLTPAQFGARFGLSASDLATATAWLQSQGFTVTAVSNSRDRITFSGSAAQVATAFGTELHNYSGATDGQPHFAPANALSLPSALGSAVLSVNNLSSFKLRSHMIQKGQQIARPDFTSSSSGNHFLQPGDVAVIYDINPAYSAGFTGTGQIAIVGQSAIVPQDIANFQTAAGLPQKPPVLFLVPNSGTSTLYTGDESESDLDVEYSGGIAKGSTVDFVFTGNNNNYGVLDALTYAIDENLAPIVSSSYGACEPAYPTAYLSTLEALAQQGAAQGQTIVAASGDAGSTDCEGETTLSTAVQQAVSVDYPAASKFITGLGGTEFPASAVVMGNNTYFTAQSSSDAITSALSYIPEQVWNDDAVTNSFSSGGGGVSIDQARPSWQTGVPGIPSGSFRLVPDVSLDASPNYAGYLFCSSDTKATGVTSSCGSGFRDPSTNGLTVAGGTSFAAPIFAGMVAIINQAKGYTNGQGLINPTLYALASVPATYSSAFHDITSGGNQCAAGNTTTGVVQCTAPATSEYAAGTGYDEASGIGSVDLNNLITAWPRNTAVAPTKSFTITAAGTTVTPGTTATTSVTTTPANGYTGTVAFTVLASTTTDVALLGNACYSITNANVTGTAAVPSTLTIYTNTASCPGGTTALYKGAGTTVAALQPANHPAPHNRVPLPATLAGLLLAGALFTRRNRLTRAALVRSSLGLVVAMLLGLGASTMMGCSSGTAAVSNPVTPITPVGSSTTTPAGSYVLNIVGQDIGTSATTANTTVTITVN